MLNPEIQYRYFLTQQLNHNPLLVGITGMGGEFHYN